jgi:hypothetical protein
MKNIYENQNALNIQYGVVLEENASFLTRGLGGYKTESCCTKRYDFNN